MKKRFWALLFLLTILCWPILCNADTTALAVASGKFRSPGWGYVDEREYKNFGNWYYVNTKSGSGGTYQGWLGLYRRTVPMIVLTGNATGKYISFYGEGIIKYGFYLRKLHQAAPDDMILPMHIRFEMFLRVESPSVSSVYYNLKAKLELTYPDNTGYNRYLGICSQTSDVKEKRVQDAIGFTATPTESMIVWINGEFYIALSEYTVQHMDAKVQIDPIITIDPDFMVNIDGVDYPANQLYEVRFSQNLYRHPMPWMQLLFNE